MDPVKFTLLLLFGISVASCNRSHIAGSREETIWMEGVGIEEVPQESYDLVKVTILWVRDKKRSEIKFKVEKPADLKAVTHDGSGQSINFSLGSVDGSLRDYDITSKNVLEKLREGKEFWNLEEFRN